MTGGDNPPHSSPPPPSNGGELLLRLVQNRHQNYKNHNQNHHQQQPPQQPPPYLPDPAIAAVGPTLPINFNNPQNPQNPNFFLQNQQGYFRHSTSQPSSSTKTPSFFSAPHHHFHRQQVSTPPTTTTSQYGPIEVGSIRINDNNSNFFGEEKNHEVGFELRPNRINGLGPNRRIEQHGSPDQRRPGPPPGFLNKPGSQRKDFENATAQYGPTEVEFSSILGNLRRDFDASAKRANGPTEVGFSSKLGDLGRDFDVFNNVAAAKTGATTQYGPTKLGVSSKPKNHRREIEGFNNAAAGKTATITQYGSTEMGSFNNVAFEKERRFSSRDKNGDVSNFNGGVGLIGQIDHPGLPSGSSLKSGPGSALGSLGGGVEDNEVGHDDEIDDLSEQLVGSVLGEDQSDEKNVDGGKKKFHRDKDFRSDARGKWILSQRMRNSRRLIECRRDIDRLDFQFLAIYESLMPVEEEIAKQKQLLTLLEQLVCKEWPNAKLYLYGSCANSFGFPKSDIDVCLAIDDLDIDKSEMLLRLADILQSGNFQDVQALTRARVPIVKLMDPVTGISCDICINNVLAVVNTKLLRDYAEIDVRLRQLAYLVKHWAKSRGVNETYHGTLSSYAYVLMCIHFLQMRNPPILPCLQNMKSTYSVTVEDIECTFFDQVEKLRNFGARNKENISKLLWGFFSYWAYCHDYPNQVISVRSGCILSKHEKDWTRRVGNDRHLICIEDPFETSHDLGRVVDKHSIRVLREEFERAAEIMQYDPNPCVALFEPYIPR